MFESDNYTRRLITFFLLLILAVFAGCSEDEDSEASTPPTLSHTPLDLSGPYNDTTRTYGDISFLAASPVIRPFGTLVGTDTYTKRLHYYTTPEAPVVAVSNGIVSTVFENPVTEGDFEVQVTSIPGSDFTIIYDYVQLVVVQADLAISAGDTIGYAGYYNDDIGHFSLQVTTGEGVNQRWYCPLIYGDDAFVSAHTVLLNEYRSQNRVPNYDSLCLQQILGVDN